MPSLADRYGHSAIYDSVYQRMIIFGGYDAGGPSADAWAFSLPASGSGTWTKLAPAGTPPAARYQHSAIFDSANQRMIVFGGQDGTSPIVDGAWALSLPGSGDGAWTQLSPSGGPPDARESHSAIYDGVNHRMIIFGGEDASWNVREDVSGAQPDGRRRRRMDATDPCVNSPLESQRDLRRRESSHDHLWRGGLRGWRSRTSGRSVCRPAAAAVGCSSRPGTLPGARTGQGAVYDAVNQRMIVFDGVDIVGGLLQSPLNEAWALSLPGVGDGTWTQLSPAGTAPAARYYSSAIYDVANQRMIACGGEYLNSGALQTVSDVWSLSLPASGGGAWGSLTPGGLYPSRSPLRARSTMARTSG